MNRVTLTGADDRTPIEALVDLSQEFPFVEWGILVSEKQEGGPRFPGKEWMETFAMRGSDEKLQVSMHVCGAWVRQMLRGQLDWNRLPEIRIVADRVQVNTHAEEHITTVAALDWMAGRGNKQFIVQLDAVNDHFFDGAVARKLNVAGLFDLSHGAGVLPDSWPALRHAGIYHGFAGGLSPDNVVDQVAKITDTVTGSLPFWIDMEGRIRTDEEFDLSKVRRVLELCAPLVNEYENWG